ncbi:hypothetical protein ACKWTF_004280 [Chironomus riparius]
MDMKYIIFIFVVFAESSFEANSKTRDNFLSGFRFKDIKCESDNTTVIFNYCYLKPVSRKVVTLNVGLKFLVPYTRPLYGHTVFYYRYGTIFREAINTPKVDWCDVIGGATTNPMVNLLMNLIKDSAPNFLRSCPFTGSIDIKNFTMNFELLDKSTMMLPEGIYKIETVFYWNDTRTINYTIIFETKSPLKEIFG